MHQPASSTALAPIEGNLALKAPRHARFVVIEGGRGGEASASGGVMRQASPICGQEPKRLMQDARALFAGAAILIAMLGLAFCLMQDAQAAAIQQAFAATELEPYTVSAGDSLWSVAAAHPVSGTNTQEVASYIKEANGLDESALSIGQTIEIPQASR